MIVESRHFLLEPHSVVSFSGGRTSAYMLFQILRAHGGRLPERCEVLFFNTGKEREETYDFVKECGQRWGVKITWLEYDRWQDDAGAWHQTAKEVDYETADRRGLPFSKLIAARSYLPNVVARFCTQELKIRTGKRWLMANGWDHWTYIVGIRADEPGRLGNVDRERWTKRHPLAEAGVCVEHVMEFWAAQPFDLHLRQDEGNCDLCFLKGRQKLKRIVIENPRLAGWWIEQEDAVQLRNPGAAVARFNKRMTVRQLVEATGGGPMFDPTSLEDEPVEDCHCTD